MSKVKFAVIGQGHIGKRHAEMIRRNPETELIAVCDIVPKEKLGLNLSVAKSSDKNLSSNYWTICKQTKLPLDPFDGIELLEEEFKPWQDKDYVSIDGYLEDIEKYSRIISDLNRVEMRKYS